SVAAVSSTGSVTAMAVGTALVIARHGVGEDTARITVAEPVAGPIACTAADEINLDVGESIERAGEGAVLLCLPGGSGSVAEYMIAPFNAGTSGAAILPVRLQATGVINVAGPPTPDRLAALRSSTRGPVEDPRFHQLVRG